ncbi:hypothetical protein SAMN05443665_10258 [Actinomadura meyerae]|jgi:hypothetical protein|uniref:Uncharacterized protein n=1 Tax=Actinomadura meyerae TaxID=240840 RepID=A0A239M112_9ACTN|nr:hypothetical protein [Actinomadura meyerae]SNT35589.1 hypothetical protein SAMN05443665_10258 [Actinomadura meyerae]
MALKRPSFLPSLDELERQAEARSADRGRPGSHFDHPTAKNLFVAVLVLTVLAHVVGGIVFLLLGF